MAELERVSAREPVNVVRKLVWPGHLRAVDQDGDHAQLTLQRHLDLLPNKVRRIVQATAPGLITRR